MTREGKAHRDDLADVAEGRGSREAIAHVEGCPACAARVAQYRAIFASARRLRESAPPSLVASVVAMMPDRRPTTFARRLSPLVPAAVRRHSPDFQIVVGDEATPLRLMVRSEEGGVLVMGRLPGADWRFEGPAATIEEDRFSFRAASLGETAFALESAERRLEIPPLAQLLEADALEADAPGD